MKNGSVWHRSRRKTGRNPFSSFFRNPPWCDQKFWGYECMSQRIMEPCKHTLPPLAGKKRRKSQENASSTFSMANLIRTTTSLLVLLLLWRPYCLARINDATTNANDRTTSGVFQSRCEETTTAVATKEKPCTRRALLRPRLPVRVLRLLEEDEEGNENEEYNKEEDNDGGFEALQLAWIIPVIFIAIVLCCLLLACWCCCEMASEFFCCCCDD